MNWKASLDRYLTTEPEDDFTPWVEQVYEEFSHEFYYRVYDDKTDFENSETEMRWLDKLVGRDPAECARIIERAYNLYFGKINCLGSGAFPSTPE